MTQRLLSKAEFARRAKVSKPAVSKALRGPLRSALVGDRIDIDQPAAVAYLAATSPRPRTAGATTPPAKPASVAPAVPTAPSESVPPAVPTQPTPRRKGSLPAPKLDPDQGLEQLARMGAYADLSMRELADRWGTFRVFVDLLDALGAIESIRKTYLHNEETEGNLIARDLVRHHVFGAIEAANKRLLGDTPRTIARRIYALVKSGAPTEEAEKVIRELIGSQLRPVKAKAARMLRGAPDNDDGDA